MTKERAHARALIVSLTNLANLAIERVREALVCCRRSSPSSLAEVGKVGVSGAAGRPDQARPRRRSHVNRASARQAEVPDQGLDGGHGRNDHRRSDPRRYDRLEIGLPENGGRAARVSRDDEPLQAPQRARGAVS